MTTMSEQRTHADDIDLRGDVPALTLPWRMKMALANVDVTAEQLADELGVHRATVSRWINGKGAAPRAAYLKMWALRTKVDYQWLASGTPSQIGPNTPDGLLITPSRWIGETAAQSGVLSDVA